VGRTRSCTSADATSATSRADPFDLNRALKATYRRRGGTATAKKRILRAEERSSPHKTCRNTLKREAERAKAARSMRSAIGSVSAARQVHYDRAAEHVRSQQRLERSAVLVRAGQCISLAFPFTAARRLTLAPCRACACAKLWQHQIAVDAIAMRAASRNALVAERARRVRHLRDQELSHIIRLRATELAASTAVWQASQRTQRPAELQRAASARYFRPTTSDVYLKKHDDDAIYGRMPMTMHAHAHLRLAQLKLLEKARDMPLYHPTPGDLEFHRPPPVMVPSDEPLLYLS
jgi:hypothetical protein